MRTIEQKIEAAPADQAEEEDLSDDSLLTRVFEKLEDDEVEVNAAAESCVPFIIDGLRSGSFEADSSNPLHACIRRVLDKAGALPPTPPAPSVLG